MREKKKETKKKRKEKKSETIVSTRWYRGST